MITYGSVCSGIEAATVAMEPAGWKASWFAEIEPFPCQVLKHHYPKTPNLGDMTKIAAMVRAGEVAAPDVLVGGTPCQAFSVAGLRQGLQDQRGQLTLSFVELANEIDAARSVRGHAPCIVWWENVPGVLSSKDNAFGCFLGALAGEDGELQPPGKKWPNAGCVFGPERAVAWRVLDAQYFGVAQRRRRVFVVASARNGFDPAAVLFEFDGLRRDSAPSREAQEETAGTITSSLGRRGGQPDCGSTPGHLQPVAYGGNNSSGSIDVATARNACASASGRMDFETETFLVQPIAFDTTQITSAANRSNPKPGDACHPLAAGAHPPAIAFDCRQDPVSSTEVFGALGSSSPQAQSVAYAIQAGALRTNPLSGPDGVGVQADHAYTLEARSEVQAVCITGDITHTLKAEGFDASEDGTGSGQPIIAAFAFAQNTRDEVRLVGGDGEVTGALAAQPGMKQTTYVAPGGMAVRRLTPIECELLQAFPPNYTRIPKRFYKTRRVTTARPEDLWEKVEGGWMLMAADGPRYKALGNSMCVKNMRWIGLRIAAQIAQAQELEAA